MLNCWPERLPLGRLSLFDRAVDQTNEPEHDLQVEGFEIGAEEDSQFA